LWCAQYFRRSFCAACGAPDREEARQRRGDVYATSLVCRAATPETKAHVPYNILLVDTSEGFRMMAHGDNDLAIGDKVFARVQAICGKAGAVFREGEMIRRHCEERSDEASMRTFDNGLLRIARNDDVTITAVEHDAGDDEHRRHRQHLRERFRGRPFGGFLHVYLPRLGRDSSLRAKARTTIGSVTRNTPRR
jgi:hypothetical protein